MELSSSWGQGIGRNIARMGLAITVHPKRWLAGILVFTLVLATQLLFIRIDSSIEGFLAPNSPVIERYEDFKQRFGADNVFIVSVETEDPFAPEFVAKLKQFHAQFEDEVPYVDRVDSLVNARYIRGNEGTLEIQELFEEIPRDPAKLQALADFVYDNKFYTNYLISKDRKLLAIIVRLVPFVNEGDKLINLSEGQMAEATAAIYRIAAQYQGPLSEGTLSEGSLSEDIKVAGGPSIQMAMGKAIERDFSVFSTLAIIIICSVLYFIFRRASGVVMPMLVMGFGVIATISTMALFDTPLQMTTAILPSFLMAVCVGDSIHLLSYFYARYDAGDDKDVALRKALEHTGVALFFTSITTAGGLATFAISELAIVANLGVFAAVGALYAFIFTVLLLPCLITLLPLKRQVVNQAQSLRFSRFVDFCVDIAVRCPVAIVALGLALFVASSYFALQLNFSQDSLKWLPEDHPVRLATMNTETRMSGTIPIEIVIDTGIDGGAINPARLTKLEDSLYTISQWSYASFDISKAIGLSDILKETNRALNDNDDAHYKIPGDPNLIRQELLLLEMDASQYLFQLTDPGYRYLHVTVMVPWLDAINYGSLTQDIENHFAQQFPESTINVTGLGAIMSQTFVKMLATTTNSYLLAFIIISVMMVLLLGNFRIGMAAMLPNLLPIAMVLALMHFLQLPLDVFSLMIGSIAVGLTVDDTVHFMHHFRHAFARHGDAARAVSETLNSAGRALAVTTLALALGFLIYTQSTLHNLQNFGLLTALCIVLALAADFLLAPALMILLVTDRKTASDFMGNKAKAGFNYDVARAHKVEPALATVTRAKAVEEEVEP